MLYSVIHVTQRMMHFTLKYSSARCKYFIFPNPYLRARMLLILLYVLSLVTAVPIQSGPSHPSPNILQLISSILKSIHCISEIIFLIFRYLTKYLLLCLNGSIKVRENCQNTITNRKISSVDLTVDDVTFMQSPYQICVMVSH